MVVGISAPNARSAENRCCDSVRRDASGSGIRRATGVRAQESSIRRSLGRLRVSKTNKDRDELARSTAVLYTSALVQSCGVRPALVYRGDDVGLVFQDGIAQGLMGGLSLAGALTVQLMASVAGHGFATCSSCGNPFTPTAHQPSFGKRRFCKNCGKRAAVAAAKTDYRKRKRLERLREQEKERPDERPATWSGGREYRSEAGRSMDGSG